MKERDMNRRQFLRRLGLGSVSAFSMMSMSPLKAFAEENTPRVLDDEVKMTYRRQNGTGENISLLGFGMMRLPREQEEVNRLVDYAIAHGVNYFDTAPMYGGGRNESVTGEALCRHPREKYYVATKMSNQNRDLWSFERAKAMYENSFRALKVDYIDYYLLHSVGGGGMDTLRGRFLDNGLLDWLMEQREAGRIRNLGFSFHGDVAVFDWALAHHDEYHWDFVQIQANYVDWENEEDKGRSGKYLYDELVKRGIPVVIMEPLLGGRLSKVPDHVVAHFKRRKPEDSVASWAFRYIGSKPAVLTVLSGMTYMEHLEDNLRTYSPLEPLTEEEQEWLEEETATLIKSYPTIDCNDCKYCMPCPYGLDIPGIFVHYNKCVNKGNVPESQQAKNYEKARRAFLVGYDRSVPKLRQANHCVECRECISHCPQQIDIPREMQRIDSFVEKLKQGTL